MNILLPIETINREIDFKIALAGNLANQGHKIYIGQHDFIMKLLPFMNEGGLYIGKNFLRKMASAENGEKYFLLKKYHFNVIYLHEEGAVFPGKEEDWIATLKAHYNLDFYDENDDICVWGDFQNKVDQQKGGKVAIHTTGHPRFDLCKEKWQSLYTTKVNEILNHYGEFVLINGNYGFSNHGLGTEYVFSVAGNYNVEDEIQRLKRVDFYCHSSRQLMAMIKLTHQLAVKFPKINFVYRPHPSENHEYYKTIYGGVKNIIINHDGPILPWILASKTVIHDGCTTALEATLAGKPVINYKVDFCKDNDIWLPNQMGVQTSKIEEVCMYLKDIIENNKKPVVDNNYEKVSELIYNFKGDSFERLLQVVSDNMRKSGISKNNTISKLNIKIIYSKGKFKTFLYKMLKPSKKSSINYHAVKFYGFQETEIAEKVKNVSAILDKKIKFTFHNSHLIEIE